MEEEGKQEDVRRGRLMGWEKGGGGESVVERERE